MPEFRMPSLGADMQAGTLVAFRKQVGDHVARGDILAEVETEKGVIEVECFHEGIVERFVVEPGTRVPVGTVLALLSSAGESAAPASPTPEKTGPTGAAPLVSPTPGLATRAPELLATPSARRAMREAGTDAAHVHGSGPHGVITRSDVPSRAVALPAPVQETLAAPSSRLRVSPLARRRAEALGVSLLDIAGTGPGGSIVEGDIVAQSKQAVGAPTDQVSSMRRAVAQAMARSKREIPHYYLNQTVDLSQALAFLADYNREVPLAERMLLGALFVRAVALALRKHPGLHGHYENDARSAVGGIHVGVAVSLRSGGLVAPAIFDADELSLAALSSAFNDVVSRAREGRLRASEMSGATITVTSLGERGVEAVWPVIIPPQVSIVGFGSTLEKPLAVDGEVVVRPTVQVSLAADHRVSDGHQGARFLHTVQSILEKAPS